MRTRPIPPLDPHAWDDPFEDDEIQCEWCGYPATTLWECMGRFVCGSCKEDMISQWVESDDPEDPPEQENPETSR
jgi:hypothetical protein